MYLYEMNKVSEHERMEWDFLAGRGLDVLCCLMDGIKTELDIATRLDMPSFSVQLYLKRFQEVGIVEEYKVTMQNEQVERSYQLVSDKIEIINCLKENNMSVAEKKERRKCQCSILQL